MVGALGQPTARCPEVLKRRSHVTANSGDAAPSAPAAVLAAKRFKQCLGSNAHRTLEDELLLSARADAGELAGRSAIGRLILVDIVTRPVVSSPTDLRPVARAVQELDRIADHTHCLALLLISGFPLAPLEPTIDGDPAALAQLRVDRDRPQCVTQRTRAAFWP